MLYIISQIIFAIGYITIFLSYQAKSKKGTLLILTVAYVINLIGYTVVGNLAILPISVFVIFRSLIFYFTDKHNYSRLWVPLLVSVFTIGVGFVNFEGWLSVMLMVGNLAILWGCYQSKKSILLICTFVLSATLITYNVVVGNIVPVVMECVLTTSLTITFFIDLYKKKKGSYNGF